MYLRKTISGKEREMKKLVNKYPFVFVRLWMAYRGAMNVWQSTKGLKIYRGDVVNIDIKFDFREDK